jgi:hypothetical protein
VSYVRLHGRAQENGQGQYQVRRREASRHENGRSVAETLDIMERTKAKDREDHRQEYA